MEHLSNPDRPLPTIPKAMPPQTTGECIVHDTLQYKRFLRMTLKYPIFLVPTESAGYKSINRGAEMVGIKHAFGTAATSAEGTLYAHGVQT